MYAKLDDGVYSVTIDPGETKLINDYKLNENELNNFILLIEKTMIL